MKLGKVIISFVMTVGVMGMSVANAFTDINSEHWAYEKVKLMQEKEIISGFEDGTFRPDTSVTREQFASILVKTLGLTNIYANIEFEDVEGHRWSKDAIKIASPYLTGYQIDNKYYFRPSEPAVREDMAVAVVKAKGLESQEPNYAVLDKFSDKDKISEGVKKYVAIAVENEIMNGNANGTFNPLGSLTRAEITALMYNVMEKVAINDVAKEEPKEIEVKSISLNDTYVELEVGETLKLKPIIKPDDADNKEVTWSSGNSDVASVDSTGKVTARHPGDTNIYVKLKANSELNAKCRITVIEKENEKDEDEDNTADDEYSVNLTSNTGSVLTDESIITAKISASENIKYAKLEIIYSPNSDWAGNGRKISESEVKEIKNGKVKFDFYECIDGVDEELTKETMCLMVVLSSEKDFSGKTNASSKYGYSYRKSLPEFEFKPSSTSIKYGELILGDDYDKYEFRFGHTEAEKNPKSGHWYKAKSGKLTIVSEYDYSKSDISTSVHQSATFIAVRYIGDPDSEKIIQIKHETPDFELDVEDRCIYLDSNDYGYCYEYVMKDGTKTYFPDSPFRWPNDSIYRLATNWSFGMNPLHAKSASKKIDLYEQFKFISENDDCKCVNILLWQKSDFSELNPSNWQTISIDINDVVEAMDFGINEDIDTWKGNTLYLTESMVVHIKGAYEGGSLKYALVYDGKDYTYGGFDFIKNPKKREETNMTVKSLVNIFKNMNDIDLREKEITIEMYYDNDSDYSWRDYSKSFTFKIHEHREDYEKFVDNKDGATHTKKIYCEPCDMSIKETSENHEFINSECVCGARLQNIKLVEDVAFTMVDLPTKIVVLTENGWRFTTMEGIVLKDSRGREITDYNFSGGKNSNTLNYSNMKLAAGKYTLEIPEKVIYNEAEDTYNAEQTIKITIKETLIEDVAFTMIDLPTNIVIAVENGWEFITTEGIVLKNSESEEITEYSFSGGKNSNTLNYSNMKLAAGSYTLEIPEKAIYNETEHSYNAEQVIKITIK